jgi:hypothetical protein
LTYVDEIARQIQAAVPPKLLPDGDTLALFRLYAVLAMAKGTRVELEDVHDAWSAWMSGEQADHPSLMPFSELQSNVRDADRPFLEAILSVAADQGLGRANK